jgi:Ca2+-binding RTX toxin-like protein
MDHVPYGQQRVVQQTPKGYVNTTDDDYRTVTVPRNGETTVEPFFNEASSGGVAVVAGTSGDDLIEIRSTRSRVIVTVSGRERDIPWKDNYFLLVYGRAGDDRIVVTDKGLGLAYLFGGTGNDTILGSSDVEFLSGEEGDDSIDGAGGGDLLVGGTGDDTLWGRGGDDLMSGEEGSDALHGNAGKDTLFRLDPSDTLFGGAGADWPKQDVVPCGDDVDCREVNPFATDDNIRTTLGRRRGT